MQHRATRNLCVFLSALTIVITAAGCLGAELFEGVQFRVERAVERPVVYALRVDAPPTVDGVLDEPWWQEAMVAEQFIAGGGAASNKASLRAAFDAQNLYLGTFFGVQDINALVRGVPADVRDGNVWGDDCIDMKFSPDGGVTSMQLLANANGAISEARNADWDWNPAWQCAATVGDSGYWLEMAIPLADLGITEPRPGISLLTAIGRNDRELRELPTAFGEPYGDVEKGAELVLGTPAEHAARASGLTLTREVTPALYLDRDVYPSLQPLATGRLRIISSPAGEALQGAPAIDLALMRDGTELEVRTVTPIEAPALDFDWRLASLEPGTYAVEARLRDDGGVFATVSEEFVIERSRATTSGRIPITVTPAPAEMAAWPITVGVPFPLGALASDENVRLLDDAGREVPVQVATSGRWSKQGSVRWLQMSFLPPVGTQPRAYAREFGPEVTRAAVADPLVVEETDAEVSVSTGVLRLVVPKGQTPGIGGVWLDGDGDGQFGDRERVMSADASFGPFMIDDAGVRYNGSRDPEAEVVLEEAGPLRAVVRASGWHVAETGERLGRWILRLEAYRGLPWLRAQHTFIITENSSDARYSDIGWSLPFSGYEYALGTPNVSAGRVQGDGAYLLQRDDLCFRVYDQGQFKEEGERAEGWMTVGAPGRRMTLAVKDLWQQFPKELEVTPGALNVHLWPAHGEEPIRTGEGLSIRNVYHSWFAHEGDVLDFTVPEEVLEYVKQDSEQYNYPNAKVANAMGLAKTHEMLLYFHPGDWESARSRDTNEVFQSAPAAVVAPEWICDSGVFGPLHPRDPEGFPEIERALDDTIDNIFRLHEMDRDYGMFNYGDAHHNWDWAGRRWNLHRIWRNTHHGWTRWPWMMYARSGDRRLLDWADANARHIADVDHCHHTTPELEKLTYPDQKLVGGICDYKGFVHWASGGRLAYNSAADAMLWHYYLTGNQRSLTTALEHGAALIADGKPQPHREGSGRTTSAVALYFLTWDNDYLEFFERTVDRLLSTQREDGSFPQWENFAPFLQRYVALTGSRRAKQAMVDWADYVAAQPEPVTGYHSKINIMAHAYLYGGDETHLRAATYHVDTFADYVYRGEDPRYRGQFINHHTNLDQSYFMQEVPYYMTAMAALGREVEPIEPTQAQIRTQLREEIDGAQLYVFRARLRQENDAPFDLRIGVRGYADAEYQATLTPVGGAASVEGSAKPGHAETSTEIALSVPADGQSEYELLVTCAQNFRVMVPMSAGNDSLREVYPIVPAGTWVGEGFRYWFNLPEGTQQFSAGYRGRSWPLQFDFYDPSGDRVSSDVWIGSNDLSDRAQQVGVGDADTSGWSFRVNGYGQVQLNGIEAAPGNGQPVYFAASEDKLFMPQ